MDEKTEELRDIFMDVAEDGTVTEHQEESRGSLAESGPVEEPIRSTVETMQERYDFHTSLSTDELVTVVREFFAGKSDAEIARSLEDVSGKTVTRARIDLHLVTERDLDAPFDLDELRDRLDEGRPMTDIADELDISESTGRHYRRILEVQDERKVASDRFREEFERVLADRELEERLTAEIKESGLQDATEGMETNVQF